MRPTFREMLDGIERAQSTFVLPKIMASGEMDALWEVGISFRLLNFLKDHTDVLLEGVFLENRDLRALLGELAPGIRRTAEGFRDRGLSDRYTAWLAGLPPVDGPRTERSGFVSPGCLYGENEALKRAVNDLLVLLQETEAPGGEKVAAVCREARERIRQVLGESATRHATLSERLLELWRG